MRNKFIQLMTAGTRRFHEGRIKDLASELDTIDAEMADLQERREKVVDQLEYHEERLGI
jgi:hypothetical protein